MDKTDKTIKIVKKLAHNLNYNGFSDRIKTMEKKKIVILGAGFGGKSFPILPR